MAKKFTPESIERIKDWVAQGVGRDEIASRLDVSVGSLQVTCSRLGIGLRQRSAGVEQSIEHVRQGDHAAQAKLTLLMQTRNRQAAFDLPLRQDLLVQLALEASFRDLTTAGLIGRIVNQAMEKDLVGRFWATAARLRRRRTSRSAPQTARREEGVPTTFGVGILLLQFVGTFATSRTKTQMNPPVAAPQIAEADT